MRNPGTILASKIRGEFQQRWKPPLENLLKLNVDTTVNNKDQKIGLGAITRGADGKVLIVGIKQAQLRESVGFAEAEAIQWGLQVAKLILNNTKGSRAEIPRYYYISKVKKGSFNTSNFLLLLESIMCMPMP